MKFMKQSGVTIIEISLAVAIMSVVAVVIWVYVQQSQKLSQSAIHTQQILATEIETLNYIAADLRAAKRSSIGNLVLNGDFEQASADGTHAQYWATGMINGIGS